MHRAVRIGLVVLGAAMAVYGAASLTGGWLGRAPWTRPKIGSRKEVVELVLPPRAPGESVHEQLERVMHDPAWPPPGVMLRKTGVVLDRNEYVPPLLGWCSVGLGLALVAVGAWPRRRRRDATHASAGEAEPAGASNH